ncbi:MAG: putative peptidoglycan glycosyltransferase FtsW [Pseudomonadota bacterium]
MFARSDRSGLAQWWFTIDRPLLTAVLALIAAGVVFSLAAGPTVADKKGYATFTFVERHALHACAGVLIVVAASFCAPRTIRRTALVLGVVMLGLLTWLAVGGPEINGARRWLRVAGWSLQPSEFMKPAFVVLVAWALVAHQRTGRHAILAIPIGLTGVVVALLLAQPDVGQTLLLVLLFGVVFFAAGYALVWPLAAGVAGLGLAGGAYALLPHVRRRIDSFLLAGENDSYQVDRAVQSFVEGGWFGRGPGEGVIKSVLPDAHTDFVLAVIAEEYGILVCLVLLGLYGVVAARAVTRIWRTENRFARTAAAGLLALLVMQVFANMGVNTGLLPAKGTTLPFISYGGSALTAAALAMGMLVAFTRRSVDWLSPDAVASSEVSDTATGYTRRGRYADQAEEPRDAAVAGAAE